MSLIVAFGNPVYDEIITPCIRTDGRVLSGCSTNACLALTRLGHQTALVGRVGADYYARFCADLQHYGITAYATPSDQTGGFRLIYDERGDRTLDVLGLAPPIAEVPTCCAEAVALIVGPILQETSVSLIEQLAAVTTAPILLDPQGLLREIGEDDRIEHRVPADFARAARHCTVIKANEVETYVLTGIDPRANGSAAVRALRELGCQIAIVTLAEAGSWIDNGECQWRIPAYTTEARDPTGAGDTYLAGFLHAYLQDQTNLYRAGCVGAATASIWIEHTGPDAPIALAEVERRTSLLLSCDPDAILD
ncbi:PfkB family carbohydrate kinase [Candidatus Chloroploca sp. Khr17]|uniref:PfkB family carbohydrate kinase n=1 Tax=Candidatus Chloroploca sp. Khr17 TaxID=2496869 RepID=UPI00101D151C|nr:PfkB family carbohydrate kinase [Candidatus Chloroploca sp. Khr17]